MQMILALNTGVATVIHFAVHQKAIIKKSSTNGRSVFSKYVSYIYIAYLHLTLSLFFFHHFAEFQ